MSHSQTGSTHLRRLAKPVRKTGYGPYLLIEAMPWLFLAMTLRTISFAFPPAINVLLYYGAQFILLLAFLVASQRMIEIAGGVSQLGKLSMTEQLRLSRAVVWRMIAIGLLVAVAAKAAGMPPENAARFVQGFDGIAFNRYFDLLLIWSPLTAIFAFLMLVEKGLGRPATLRGSAREFAIRWPYLLSAALIAMPCILLLNGLQSLIGPPISEFVTSFLPERLRLLAVITVLFAFAFVRLWLTVALLTYALRRSYRATSSHASGLQRPGPG